MFDLQQLSQLDQADVLLCRHGRQYHPVGRLNAMRAGVATLRFGLDRA